MMKNILFYKYTDIKNPQSLKEKQLKLCKSLNLLGTILIAEEGINGCLSGTEKNTEKYISRMYKDPRFSDIAFKKTPTDEHDFKRISVKVRKEIVSSKFKANIKNAAKYITPKKFKELLNNSKNMVLLDVRNYYETKIGKFKNALTLPISTFRQFPDKINQLQTLKDKKIITYCTGGIRCEKASAYLLEHGFKDVQQLHGGILNYGKECGNTHWEGKCFVFDNRVAIDISQTSNKPISKCVMCSLPCADYHNCSLTTCDKRFIACDGCIKTLKNCCSENCRNVLIG